MPKPTDAELESFMEFLMQSPKGRMTRKDDSVHGRCPTEHEDRNPSFSFKKSIDAWACSCGGGKGSELRTRLNWTWRGAPASSPAPRLAPAAAPATIEWAVKNLKGEIVCTHIRRNLPDGTKRYSWSVPGKDGEGLHGMRAADLPLYGTEKLSNGDPKVPVVLCEGEKSADALQELAGDLVVTLATVTGASGTPSPATLEVLKGRAEIHLWPDHDDIGRMHMERIAQSLKGMGVPSRTIAWKNAHNVGDDAADFVSRGASVKDLNRLLGKLDWREILNAQPVPATDLASLVGKPVPYIIKPIAVRGALTQVQGIPKGGKSAFTVFVSLCAAAGEWPQQEIMGPVNPGQLKVLYLAWEDPDLMMAQRLSLYGQGLGFTKSFLPPNLTFLFAPEIFVERGDHAEALRQAITEIKPDIVVFDTLSHVHLCDENAASEMKIPMRALDRIARETQTSVIYLHHTRKGADGHATEKGRGSQSIAAAWHVLVDWGLREEGSNVNPVKILSKYEHKTQNWDVRYVPVYSGEPVPHGQEPEVIQVKWEIERHGGGAAAAAKPQKVSRADVKRTRIIGTVRELCLASLDGCTTAKDVASACGLGLDSRSIKRHLTDLCTDGALEFQEGLPTKGGRSPDTYRPGKGNLSDL
jgi:hypothetical protein